MLDHHRAPMRALAAKTGRSIDELVGAAVDPLIHEHARPVAATAGTIIWEGPSEIDCKPIVVIATKPSYLCNGVNGAVDSRRDIAIVVHGASKIVSNYARLRGHHG